MGLLLMPLLLARPASAQDLFDHVIVIADAEQTNQGHVALDASQPGKVDIAWRAADGGTRYTQWDRAGLNDNHGIVINGEKVCGLTHTLLGIRRHDDALYVGANNHKHLNQWSRQADGSWENNDSGVSVAGYHGATADWDVNPKTGRGGFIGITTTQADEAAEPSFQRVYVEQQEDGQWKTTTLDPRHQNSTRAAMTYTRTGVPIVAYQVLEKGNETIVAGAVTARRTAEAQAYRWFPLDIASDATSTLHLLVVLHTGQTNYYRMTPRNNRWVGPATIIEAGHYGDAVFTRIAVNAKGTRIAALVQDKEGNLLLAATNQRAEQWATVPLPGAKAQAADVAFGPDSELYVCYHDAEAEQLKLLVAVD